MRSEKDSARPIDRRHLLTGAGLAAGAAIATTTAAAAGEKAASTQATSPQQHAGYRETESVKTYYKLARF
jgi:hypothetical protein